MQQSINSKKITNICDPKYDNIRKTLVSNGKSFYYWFINYFVPQNTNDNNNNLLVISNPNHFYKLIESYTKDPCDDDNKTI